MVFSRKAHIQNVIIWALVITKLYLYHLFIGRFGDYLQKPLAVLNKSINQQVIVELKAKRSYRGILEGYDPHMNIVLKNAEEVFEGNVIRKLESTIVRGDNIIYISP